MSAIDPCLFSDNFQKKFKMLIGYLSVTISPGMDL